MSQALIDLEITHEEFKKIIYKRTKYKEMKESTRNIKSNDELSEKTRDNMKNIENKQI